MSRQSTRYLLMVEPASFGFNPETASINDYQVDARDSADAVQARALSEFRAFRDQLVSAGVSVMTVRGPKGYPSAIFPDWFLTGDEGAAHIFPMFTPGRQRERSADVTDFLRKFYTVREDIVPFEVQGQALQGTGSLVLDRVNRVAYAGVSQCTDEKLAHAWCAHNGYECVLFETIDHAGKPVYHTSMMMWIGTEMAGIGSQMIASADRARVLDRLSRTHEVLELDNAQIRHFAGNALEVRGRDDQHILVMSDAGFGQLTSEQISRINRYYIRTISPSVATIETYGGASVRSMVQELF